MANYPIYRLVKGSTLTFTEMDDNLRWLSANMSASVVTITGSTYVVGNLNVSNGITGSLFGTSSWAVSASWAPSNPPTNIYTANGILTENRIVDIDNKTLTFANATNIYYTSSTGTFINLQASLNTAFISMNYYDTGSNLIGGWGYGNSNVISPVYRNKIYFAGVNVPYSIIMNSVETSRNYVNGNVKIQTGGTYIDNGYKLQVSAQNTSSGSLWVSGSSVITGSLSVTEGITGSNALITGTITAQTLVVQTITSSITYSSGSNIFGNKTTDTHQFTGSVLAPSITGSLQGTSSWAVSASWAPSSTVSTISSFIATGSISASVNTDISASFRLTSGSNTLLNVTREGFVWIGNGSFVNQGFQLDVQGTTRVSGQVNIIDSSATSGTGLSMFGGTFSVANSGGFRVLGFTNGAITVTGGNNFIVSNNATISLYSSAATSPIRLGNSSAYIEITNNSGVDKITLKPSLFRGDTPQYLDIVSNDATATFGQRSGTIRIFAGEQASTNGYGYIVLAHNGSAQRGTVAVGANTTHASAILDVTSITQGVLLPRMTAAQRTAISTPAQGLLVYDTGSVTEGLWYYSSGSNPGWQEVLTNSGSQSISGSLTATNFTGSLQGTSSWAISASWAPSAGGGTTLNGSGYVSMSGTTVAYVSAIPNSSLSNSAITIQGSTTALGGSVNVINGTGFVKSSGTSITYDNSTYYLASNPNGYTSNLGTVTSVTVSAGTGLSGGGTITSAGTITLTNAAPDQTVVLNNGTGISVTGTYPNFTIASTVTDTNIYNSNGTLSGNRIVTGASNRLTFSGINGLVVTGSTTNEVMKLTSVEPYLVIQAEGATNPASIFLRPSTSAQNATIQNRTGGGLEFYTGATPSLAATIASNLNLGVGITNPQTKVEVYNTTDDTHFSAVGSAPSLNLRDNNITATIAGTIGLATGPNNFIQNSVPGDLCISTRGSTNAAAYIMFGSGSTMTAFISGSGDMYIKGTLTQGSTRNIKQNIVPINNALSTLMEMQGVTYDKKDGSATNEPGFIAEDLYAILPSLVSLDKNGDPHGVKYTNLTAYLVEAIKELKKEIDILKNK